MITSKRLLVEFTNGVFHLLHLWNHTVPFSSHKAPATVSEPIVRFHRKPFRGAAVETTGGGPFCWGGQLVRWSQWGRSSGDLMGRNMLANETDSRVIQNDMIMNWLWYLYIETVSSWGIWSCQAQRLRWVLSAQASWSKLVSSQIQVSKWWSKVYVRNCLLNSQCSGWDKKQKRRWKRDVRRSTSRCFCLRALMSRFCASSWSGLNGTASFFWEDALARQQQASKPATPKEAAKQIQLHCCDLGLVNQHHCAQDDFATKMMKKMGLEPQGHLQ